jgi:hypothetical protein
VLCVNGEAHTVFAVYFCDSGVIYAHNFVIVHSEAGFGLDFPMDTVIRKSKTEVCSFERLFIVIADIVAEYHNVFSVFAFQYARIESKRGWVRNVFTGKNGFGITGNTRFRFEK